MPAKKTVSKDENKSVTTKKKVTKTPDSKKIVKKRIVSKKKDNLDTTISSSSDTELISLYINDIPVVENNETTSVDDEINQAIAKSSMKIDLIEDQQIITEDILDIPVVEESIDNIDVLAQDLDINLPQIQDVEQPQIEYMNMDTQSTSNESLESLDSLVDTQILEPEFVSMPLESNNAIEISQDTDLNSSTIEKQLLEEPIIPIIENSNISSEKPSLQSTDNSLLDLSQITTNSITETSTEKVTMWLDISGIDIPSQVSVSQPIKNSSSSKWVFVSIFSFLMLCFLAWALYFVYDVMDPNRELLASIMWDINKWSNSTSNSYTVTTPSFEETDSSEWDFSSSLSWEVSSSETFTWVEESEETFDWENFTWESILSWEVSIKQDEESILSWDFEKLEVSSSSQNIDDSSETSAEMLTWEESSSSSSELVVDQNWEYATRLEKLLSLEEEFKNMLKISQIWWESVARKMILVWLKKTKNLKSALEKWQDFDITDLDSQIASIDRLLLSASKKLDE